MIKSFSFIVPGEVRGQGRPRTTIRGGYASIYDSPEDKANKHNIQLMLQKQCLQQIMGILSILQKPE